VDPPLLGTDEALPVEGVPEGGMPAAEMGPPRWARVEDLVSPWWGRSPGTGEPFACTLIPVACGVPAAGEAPPLAPERVYIGFVFSPGSTCASVPLSWMDASDDETGFYIWRSAITAAPRRSPRLDLIAVLEPNPGSGAEMRYVDESIVSIPGTSQVTYVVSSFNAAGVSHSVPSRVHEQSCDAPPGVVRPLMVEALEMNVADSLERLYCYVSLGGSPYVRVPAGTAFVTPEAGGWNIAEHFSGPSGRRHVMPLAGEPLEVAAECLGWRGGELLRLGAFRNTHPEVEWDGRLLTGGPADGRYHVVYRILPSVEVAGGGAWPIVDASIPAPHNVSPTTHWVECSRPEGSTCLMHEEPGISWEWDHLSGPTIRGFKVYQTRNYPPFNTPTLYHEASFPSHSAPLADCPVRGVGYSVSAVLAEPDPVTGEDIESPLSEEIWYTRFCEASLEITLDALQTWGVCDRRNCRQHSNQAYGWISVNGHRIRWNNHCDGHCLGGGRAGVPSTTTVRQTTRYFWEDMFLSLAGGPFARDNHQFQISIEDGEALWVAFEFKDHDRASGDDVWCRTDLALPVLPARSAEEWLRVDEAVNLLAEGPPQTCDIGFRVEGFLPSQ
jgi:hypothetical protein